MYELSLEFKHGSYSECVSVVSCEKLPDQFHVHHEDLGSYSEKLTCRDRKIYLE